VPLEKRPLCTVRAPCLQNIIVVCTFPDNRIDIDRSHTFTAAFQNRGSKSGNITPKTMNSLTAIAGHEGDEDEWEREIGGYSAHDEEVSMFLRPYFYPTSYMF